MGVKCKELKMYSIDIETMGVVANPKTERPNRIKSNRAVKN